MVHPDSELRFIDENVGHGVVATKFIPRGTITWAADDLDQIFTPDRVRSLSPFLRPYFEKYTFVNGQGEYVLCWDHARLMNHSCEPTCLSAGFDFEIAVRDIHPGEQLSCEYATLNLEEDFKCHCGSRRCRGTIYDTDLLRYAPEWDRIIAGSFPLVTIVEQPLWPLVQDKEAVRDAAAGLRPVPSILNHCLKRNV